MCLPMLSRSGRAKRIRRGLWRFVKSKPLGAIGGLIVLAMVLMAIFAPLISPANPRDRVGLKHEPPQWPPTWEKMLGTDSLGRDVLSRTIHGSRVSIRVGILSVLLGITAGLVIGGVAAYVGGSVDLVIQRMVDAMMALPPLVLALFLVATLRPSLNTVTIAIAVTTMPGASRTFRSAILGLKETTHVDAARAIGCPPHRVLIHHIFPNVTALYLILISLAVGNAIIVEASLTFLGLGISPDIPSWGGMVSVGSREMLLTGQWVPIAASVAIALTVYGFNMLGDALRDALDPRLRRG